MEDTKYPAIKKVELTSEEYRAMVERVESCGLERRNFLPMKDDDFIAGAISVLTFFGIPCPIWPLLIGSGREWISETVLNGGKKQ